MDPFELEWNLFPISLKKKKRSTKLSTSSNSIYGFMHFGAAYVQCQ